MELDEELGEKTAADLQAELNEAEAERDTYKSRLRAAADQLADLGCIINTPYSKRRWVEGY